VARDGVANAQRGRAARYPGDAVSLRKLLANLDRHREVRELPGCDLQRRREQAGCAQQHLVVTAHAAGQPLRQVLGALRELRVVTRARGIAPAEPGEAGREDSSDQDEPGQAGELASLELRRPGRHYLVCRALWAAA
jgi:hypothetical protein